MTYGPAHKISVLMASVIQHAQIQTMANPGPLMLGVLDKRKLVVAILIHTLIVQIRVVHHRSKRLNEHISLT